MTDGRIGETELLAVEVCLASTYTLTANVIRRLFANGDVTHPNRSTIIIKDKVAQARQLVSFESRRSGIRSHCFHRRLNVNEMILVVNAT